MKCLLRVPILIAFAATAAEAQYVQTAPGAGISQTVNQQSGTSLNVNILNNQYVVGQGTYTTIQLAVTAAGTTGSVVIPPSYTGTDTWTNPNNIIITDLRPVGVNNHYPTRVVKAADYGVKCSGNVDDSPAINAALAAATVIASEATGSPMAYPNVGATVELPQGLCLLHSPILMKGYGSLQGSANGTWLLAAEPWTGDLNIVEVVNPYTGTANLPNGLAPTSQVNRFVKDINFQYFDHVHNITGIKIWNPTGTSQSMPYPQSAAADTLPYQIPFVRIEGDAFFAMDTAVDIEDCNNCILDRDNINYVRNGVLDSGNNFVVTVSNTLIQQGSYSYTSIKTGPAVGLQSNAQTRWVCSNNVVGCTGGTTSLNQIVSPQGFTVHDTAVSGFDRDAYIVNAQGLDFHDDGFDFGGNGAEPGTPNPTIYIGNVNWAQFHHNLVATYQANDNAIEVAAAAGAPTDGSNRDGIWITDNYIQSYQTTSTASGIYFYSPDSDGVRNPTWVKRNFYIQNNQFSKLGYGIYAASPLQYSVIRGNYGFYLVNSLITFNYAGSTAFQATIVADNTTPDAVPVIVDTSGGGYQIGYNQSGSNTSPKQLTGTQVATATSCTITAGAIGNTCLTAITFPIPYPSLDTNYTATCTGSAGVGPWGTGDLSSLSNTGFNVRSVAFSTGATAFGGLVQCNITHR